MSGSVVIKAPHWSESWLMQWVVLLVLFAVAFALWQFAPIPPQASAWLASEHYLSVAQELAQGHGFTLVANPILAQSVADTPPLYPLLVAALMQATGHATWAAAMPVIMGVQLGLYLVGILLVFMFTRVRLKGARALLLASWFTLWPSVWGAAKVPGPEMLALVCVLMALWVTDKYFAKTGDKIKPAHVLHCAVWCVASVLAFPMVGLVLMLAFVLVGYVKLGVKRGSNAVIGMAVALLPWFLWFVSRHAASWQMAANYLFPEQHYLAGGGVFTTPVDTALDWIAAHSAQGLWGSIAVANIPIIGPWLAPQFAISQWAWGAVGLVRWVSLLGIVFGALVGLSQFSGVAGGVVLLLVLLALATGQVDILAHPVVLPFTGLCTLTGLHWVALGLKEVQLQPIGKMLINAATLLVVLQTVTLLPVVSVGVNGLTAYARQPFYHAHNGFAKPYDSVMTALPSDMAVLEALVNWRHRTLPAGAATGQVWFSNTADLLGLYAAVPVVKALPALDANLAEGVRQLGHYYCWFSPSEKAGGGAASTMGSASDVMLPAGLPRGSTLVFQRRGVRVWAWR